MLENLLALPHGSQLALTAVFSLLVGSFLNVVILRIPKRMHHEWTQQCHLWLKQSSDQTQSEKPAEETDEATSDTEQAPPGIVTKGSHCPQCKVAIKPWHNIPILGYLWLGGKCANCKCKISPRYPFVEALTAILSVIVIHHFGFSTQGFLAVILTWILIALTFIDFDHQLLPDEITLPGLWMGLIISLWTVFATPQQAIIGAACGYLSLWLVFHAFKRVTGKEGMGYGDFKLLALFGAWFGWQLLPQIIFISTVVGSLVGLALIVSKKINRDKPIPFGPYLAIAGWIAMLWGDKINNYYLSSIIG